LESYPACGVAGGVPCFGGCRPKPAVRRAMLALVTMFDGSFATRPATHWNWHQPHHVMGAKFPANQRRQLYSSKLWLP
jgi:hypothetical protein